MRFLKRDATLFTLHRPAPTTDSDGDKLNTYNKTPDSRFYGHIQPYREQNTPSDYGLSIDRTHVIYTPELSGFTEADHINDGLRSYEIKAVRRYNSYARLLAAEVPNE